MTSENTNNQSFPQLEKIQKKFYFAGSHYSMEKILQCIANGKELSSNRSSELIKSLKAPR